MKGLIIIGLLLAGINMAYAEEECPPAADAAEAQNPNAFKNCDYSDKGLNGVLHRAWAKKTAESDNNEAPAQPKSDKAVVKEEVAPKDSLADSEFNSAQQLQNLRFNLVQKAARECPRGFVVENEKFLPASGKMLKLELIYHCVQ